VRVVAASWSPGIADSGTLGGRRECELRFPPGLAAARSTRGFVDPGPDSDRYGRFPAQARGAPPSGHVEAPVYPSPSAKTVFGS
jgi:hypothetical protein